MLAKYLKTVAVIAISAAAVLGCAGIPEEEYEPEENSSRNIVNLTIYYSSDNTNEMAAIESMCESFMQEHNDILLTAIPSDRGIYSENLKVKEALGEMPDICQIQNPDSFVKAGVLGEIPKEVYELIKRPIEIDQKVYAVPMYTTTYGIIYNKVMFDRYNLDIPKTYDEFLEICNILSKNGEYPLAVGGSRADSLSYWLHYFYQIDIVNQEGAWQYRRNLGDVKFQDTPMKNMFEHYTDLLSSKYILEDSVNMNDSQIVSNLVQGNACMIYTGPWMFSQIVDADGSATDFYKLGSHEETDEDSYRLGWFFMPDREGKTVAMEIKTMNWAISKECSEDTDKKNAASLFLKYFYQKENYRSALKAANALPTTKEAVLYPMIGAQQKLMVDYRYAEKAAEYFGNYQTPEGFEGTLYQTLKSVVTGTISLDGALKRLDQGWDTRQFKDS